MFDSKRLFVGLDLPMSLQAELAALDPAMPGLRWLPAGQMHLSLSFQDKVNEEGQARLQEALAKVKVPPFVLPVEGMDAFRSRGKLSVVWAGVGGGHPHLFLLHRRVQDAVLAAGLEPDLRPFKPHVTLARTRTLSRQVLQPFLRRYAEAEFGMMRVEHFTLYSSELEAEGAVHQVEMRVELVG